MKNNNVEATLGRPPLPIILLNPKARFSRCIFSRRGHPLTFRRPPCAANVSLLRRYLSNYNLTCGAVVILLPHSINLRSTLSDGFLSANHFPTSLLRFAMNHMFHGSWLKLAVGYSSAIATYKVIQLCYSMVKSNTDLLDMIPRQNGLEHPRSNSRVLD